MDITSTNRRVRWIAGFFALWILSACGENPEEQPRPSITDQFVTLVTGNSSEIRSSLDVIQSNWEASFAAMAIEIMNLSRSVLIDQTLQRLIEDEAGRTFETRNGMYDWLWRQPYVPHPEYAAFKSKLYRLIDPKFEHYFDPSRTSLIRLDEVRWGGVRQDGIPPLRNPEMISAEAADYLEDEHVVFGISVNGDHRAYPKRILAWHEMFEDIVGDEAVNGVYCTLCGSMILYKTVHDGTEYRLGTSGFLYRSNKLMYDRKTQSLWNTLLGKPVIGPLANQDIELERLSTVTTTWGEWKNRHPDTTVLSLNTGHHRDYSEGAAYRNYFATDDLMFTVPEIDTRLPNKAEVLALTFPNISDQPLAIEAAFLADHPVYHDRIGSLTFVILTDHSGANRVYKDDSHRFIEWDGKTTLTDKDGQRWTVSEIGLTGPNNEHLPRLSAHRAFWFGWNAVHKDTRLVKR